MKLSECFAEDDIIAALTATDKVGVIHEMIRHLCDTGSVPKKQAAGIERTVMRREDRGTTGIGKGVAIPHAKHTGIRGTVGCFARARDGIEYEALDGQPVTLIFLLVSAPDAVDPHVEALRKITELIKDDDFCAFMRRAKDRAELVELLRESNERFGG